MHFWVIKLSLVFYYALCVIALNLKMSRDKSKHESVTILRLFLRGHKEKLICVFSNDCAKHLIFLFLLLKFLFPPKTYATSSLTRSVSLYTSTITVSILSLETGFLGYNLFFSWICFDEKSPILLLFLKN